jgi:hypothetical protein
MGELEDQGAMEWAGMDGDDAVFAIDLPRLKELSPVLYESMMEDILADIDESLLNLYKRGFVEVEYGDDLVPTFTITPEGISALGNFDNL